MTRRQGLSSSTCCSAFISIANYLPSCRLPLLFSFFFHHGPYRLRTSHGRPSLSCRAADLCRRHDDRLFFRTRPIQWKNSFLLPSFLLFAFLPSAPALPQTKGLIKMTQAALSPPKTRTRAIVRIPPSFFSAQQENPFTPRCQRWRRPFFFPFPPSLPSQDDPIYARLFFPPLPPPRGCSRQFFFFFMLAETTGRKALLPLSLFPFLRPATDGRGRCSLLFSLLQSGLSKPPPGDNSGHMHLSPSFFVSAVVRRRDS